MIYTYPEALTEAIKARTEVISVEIDRCFLFEPFTPFPIFLARGLTQRLLIHFKSLVNCSSSALREDIKFAGTKLSLEW
jgi:hypothetical protein